MLLLPLLAMTAMPAPTETTMFVGTYTDPNASKGIYRVSLNQETGALSSAALAAETTAPSYLCIRSDGKFLYSVNEYTGGEATAFAIENGTLRKLNTVTFEGGGPCHVSLDPTGKWLLVSGYGGGVLSVLTVQADGSLGGSAKLFKNKGSGPNQKRQEKPHLHFASFVGRFAYACDLGTDEVLAFAFENGSLTQLPSGKTEPGAGPRHFVVSRDGKNLYANNEMGMGVSVFERNPDTGKLSLIQTETTLPNCDPDLGFSTAAIRMHPRLPVFYVSNRGHHSISIFDIKPTGKVERKGIFQLDTKEPRDFNIDPSGAWMVVAGQNSDELVSVKIDPSSGLLTATEHRSKVPKPVCVAFLPVVKG